MAEADARGWRSLAAVLLIVFAAPAAIRVGGSPVPPQAGYGDGSKPPGAPAFDDGPIEELKQARPDYLFIGNSNTDTRVHEQRLEQLTGGEVLVQAHGGSAGVHWYLQIKNHVIASGVRPRKLFVLFRDHELTDFSDAAIDTRLKFSRGHEPALQAIDQNECTTAGMRFRAAAHRAIGVIWPLSYKPEDGLLKLATALAPESLLGGSNELRFRLELTRRFGLGHLRADAPDALIDSVTHRFDLQDFSTRAACSALPFLLDEARDAGLDLVLVRIQRRSWTADDLELERSMQELAAFVRAHGASFVDLSGDERIQPEWYGQSDHIAERYMQSWTEVFHQRLSRAWSRD